MGAIEVGMAKIEFAHPALRYSSRVSHSQLRKMSLVEKDSECDGDQLSGSPRSDQENGRAFRNNLDHDIETQSGGEQERRVVREHREIEAQRECRHVARGISRESFVQKVERSGEEGQQQRVLPDLGCDLDDRRQKSYEEQSDQSGKSAGGAGKPFIEHPAEGRTSKHGGHAKP